MNAKSPKKANAIVLYTQLFLAIAAAIDALSNFINVVCHINI
jgi:hypothetical protein